VSERPPPVLAVLRLLADLPLEEVASACERGGEWMEMVECDVDRDRWRWEEFRTMLDEIRSVAWRQQRDAEQRDADEAATEVGT
jgi:hypothetical protein